jgi:hypothetical protein
MAVGSGQRQCPLHGRRTLWPGLFDRLVIKTLVRLLQENPRQCTLAKAVVQRGQARQFLHPCYGDRLSPTRRDDCRMRRKEAQPALGPKAPRQIPYGFGGQWGLLSPLGRGAGPHEEAGADHGIASLHALDKAEGAVGISCQRGQPRSSPLQPIMVGCVRSNSARMRLEPLAAPPGSWALGLSTCGVERERLLSRGWRHEALAIRQVSQLQHHILRLCVAGYSQVIAALG